MQLSQVDPWNGCIVCRHLAEHGVMPCHNWTHELRIWWNDKVPAWTYGSAPKYEPLESPAVGVSGTTIGLAGVALSLSLLADNARKEEADDAK